MINGSDIAGFPRGLRWLCATLYLAALQSVAWAVMPVEFSVHRGWYDTSFQLVLSAPDQGATIRYTTNGAKPSPSVGTVYSGPIPINGTTTIRAVSYIGADASEPQAHTYLFAADIIAAGYMDTGVTQDGYYGPRMEAALKALPVVSLHTPSLATNQNSSAEVETSIEYIPTNGTAGIGLRSGLETWGGSPTNPKKAYRLEFKAIYGATKLEYPLFDDGHDYTIPPAREFDRLILRTGSQDGLNGEFGNENEASFIRNRLAWDIQDRLGFPAPHGRFVHVIHNGAYQGQYQLAERPDGGFFESYYGRDKDDYEIRKSGGYVGAVVSPRFYDQMGNYIAGNDLNTVSGWNGLGDYLDVDQTATYLLLNHFGGNFDWGLNHNNWGGAFPQSGEGGYKFILWDFDLCLGNPGKFGSAYNDPALDRSSDVGPVPVAVPDATEFKVLMGDAMQCACFDDGPLTPASLAAAWSFRANQVRLPLVAEAARWGNVTFTVNGNVNADWEPEDEWLAERDEMLNNWIPARTGHLVTQYQNRGRYTSTEPVVYNQNGGAVGAGFQLTLGGSGGGTIHYTFDGTDPRAFGGQVSSTAQTYSGPVPLPAGVTDVRARRRVNGVWSAMCPKRFYPPQNYGDIVVNEIHYHPSSACGGGDSNELDFVEIHNRGGAAVDLSDSEFTIGVRFRFPFGTVLPAGGFLVLAENEAVFETSYGFAPFGQYRGKLDNGGERLRLVDPQGGVIDEVTYNDKGDWDPGADGLGPSLELLDPALDNNLGSSWLASPNDCGTPGVANSHQCAAPDIVIHEINYHGSDAPGTIGDREWIELRNLTGTSRDLGGYELRTDSTSIVFAAGATIPANGYLVVAGGGSPFPTLADGASVYYVPDLDFDNGGERLLLFSGSGCLVDMVVYDDSAPWPTEPDGAGPTLSLSDPNLDNTLAASWRSSQTIGGTPGAANTLPNCGPGTASVVINEINYASGGGDDPDDWVELLNTGAATVDLGGWQFHDSTGVFTVPGGTSLAPGGYLVLARDPGKFQSVHPAAGPVIGPLGFDLGGDESLALYDAGRCHTMAAVAYQSTSPWPTEPNGQGPTLSLNDPALDATKAFNWQPSVGDGGTPGAANNIPDPCLANPPVIVINEIHIDGPTNDFGGDWVELHNPGPDAISLNGWALHDDRNSFALGSSAIIGAGGYLVVAQDLFSFQSYWGVPAVGSTGFGLSGRGENLWFTAPGGCVVDHLLYGSAAPWPNNPDTLALVDPTADNALAESWAEANGMETPGSANVWRSAPGGVDNDLFLWFVADDGFADGVWADRSGRTNDAQSVAAAKDPAVAADTINGHDSMVFNGSKTLSLVDLPGGNKSFFTVLQATEHQSYLRWQAGGDSFRLDHNGQLLHGLNPPRLQTGLANGPNWQLAGARARTGVPGGVLTTRGGAQHDIGTWDVAVQPVGGGHIGSVNGDNQYMNGQIAEIIALDQAASTNETRQILTYLSIKYGLTIPVGEHLRYEHATHSEHFAGLAIDLRSELDQRSGESVEADAILRVFAASDLDQGESLTWGSDGAAAAVGGFEVPNHLDDPLVRTWRFTRVGDPGTVSVAFDLAGLGIDLSDTADFNLLIDTNGGSFADAAIHQAGRAINGTVVSFTEAPIGDGDRLALATVQNIIQAALAGPGDVTEPEMVNMSHAITDPDGNGGMVFSLAPGAPNGAGITSTGVFTWNPTESQGPGAYDITVIGEDTSGPVMRYGEYNFTITVAEVNRTPSAPTPGPFTVDELSELAFTWTATDPDIPANAISYSLGAGAPSGADIDADSGAFTWTPSEAQGPGVHEIDLRATDNGSPPRTRVRTVTITVDEVNTAPSIPDSPPESIAESQPYTKTLDGSDPDLPANTLSYSLVSGPAGAAVLGDQLTWTPTEAQGPGAYDIVVQVTDDGSPPLSGNRTVRLDVTEVNRAPSIAPVATQQAEEETLFELQLTGTDPDLPANNLSFAIVSGPAGGTLSADGLFAWTPDETDGGTVVTVEARVTDDGTPALSSTRSFDIEVGEFNHAPVIAGVPDQSFREMQEWTLDLTNFVSDADTPAQTLTHSLVSGPSGVAVSATGLVSWNPTETQGPGAYDIVVAVTDDGAPPLSATQTIAAVVTEHNRTPSFPAIADQGAVEHTLFELQLLASDPDVPTNTLSFSLVSGPAGATVSAAGLFAWTPDETDGGTVVTVEARVTDDGTPALSSTRSFDIEVGEFNHAPVFADVPDQSFREMQEWTLDLTNFVSDADTPAQTLTHSLVSGPAGVAVSATGLVSWNPTETQGPGAYDIVVAVTDDGAPPRSATQTIAAVVTEHNRTPSFPAIADQSAAEHTLFEHQLLASDPDLPTNTLSFSLVSGPAGATVSAAGLFTWTPGETDGGSVSTVTVRVTDDGVPPRSRDRDFAIAVAEVNASPTLDAVADQVVGEETNWTHNLGASDPDLPAQTLGFALVNGPPGLAVAPDGTVSWTPTEVQGPGSYTVVVQVSDNGVPVRSDTNSFEIAVFETNSDPSFGAIPPRQADEHEWARFQVQATDADTPAQTLGYALGDDAPEGMTIDPATGDILWLPDDSHGGQTIVFSVVAEDGQVPPGVATGTVSLLVDEVNQAPVVYAGAPCTSTTVLATSGDGWRYRDNGLPAAATWTRLEYDDSAWPVGVTELGFGDGDEDTVLAAGRVTYYFRRGFTVANPGALAGFHLRFKRDDGIVVHLNGREIIRDNMPAGAITSNTTATVSVFGAEERTWIDHDLDPGLLAAGDNVFAVEVHQVTSDSSDLTFDLEAWAWTLEDCGHSATTEVGGTVATNVQAWDPDQPAQTVVLSVDTPTNASIDAAGLLTWTPGDAQVGDRTVRVHGTDSGGAVGVLEIAVLVTGEIVIDANALSVDGDLVWNSTPGVTYVIETCDDLLGDEWFVFDTVTASGDTTAVTDPALAPADPRVKRYYRIRVQ